MESIAGLKEMVTEASQALAGLDAERLEEMAISCQALNRFSDGSGRAPELSGPEALEVVRGIAVLRRVLEATGQNLRVLRRLHEMRAGRLEYEPPRTALWDKQTVLAPETAHGDD